MWIWGEYILSIAKEESSQALQVGHSQKQQQYNKGTEVWTDLVYAVNYEQFGITGSVLQKFSHLRNLSSNKKVICRNPVDKIGWLGRDSGGHLSSEVAPEAHPNKS